MQAPRHHSRFTVMESDGRHRSGMACTGGILTTDRRGKLVSAGVTLTGACHDAASIRGARGPTRTTLPGGTDNGAYKCRRSACVVHVYEVSAHHSAAHAYSKRRGGYPCHRRLREVPSGCVPGHGVRVERRARVLAGRRSFVSIHTRSVVARDPRPGLYRGVRDASQLLNLSDKFGKGKGVKILTFLTFYLLVCIHECIAFTLHSRQSSDALHNACIQSAHPLQPIPW